MEKDSFENLFEIELSDRIIKVKRKQKLNYFLIAIMFFLLIVFTAVAVLFFDSKDISDPLFFIALDLIIVGILYVNLKDFAYGELEVDFKRMQAIQKPKISLFGTKTTLFKSISSVDFLVKPISGYASPFEEGNTDYRKKLVITTNNEDITLFSYINRNKDLEDSAEKIVGKLQELIGTRTLV